MTFYVQEMHRTSACNAGNCRITDDDQPADFAEPFETLEAAMSFAQTQAAEVVPEWKPRLSGMDTFGVWPWGIERPIWEVYEEPDEDTPERDAWDGFAEVYGILDPLEPMEDLRDLLEETRHGYSIAESLCEVDGEEVDLCVEAAEQLDKDGKTRQAIECRKPSLVRFRSDLAVNGHSWALLEDGRCGGLLGGLDCERPTVDDVLFADWWSADDCDLSTTQGKQAAVIYAIIADVVSWG